MFWESEKVATIWGNIKKLCNGAKEKSFHFSSNGLLFDFFFLKKAKDLGLRWQTEKHCCIKSFQGSKGPQFYAKRNNPLNFFCKIISKSLLKIHTFIQIYQIDPPIWSTRLIHINQSITLIYQIDLHNWYTW